MRRKKEDHDQYIAAGLIAAYAAGMLMMAAFHTLNDNSWKSTVEPQVSGAESITCPNLSLSLEEQALQISNGECN